jgi:hypothetical protein
MARWDNAWHWRLRSIITDLPFRTQAERIAIRRELAKDPVAFAVLYLSHHLRDDTGRVTFSEAHYEWARVAEGWRAPLEPQENRHAFIAPRETGKSTWWFLVLPLWGAANEVVRFAVAFANADAQATGHLSTFKRELDTNALLRADYPDLCTPARKPTSGATLADRQGMLHTKSGFVFAAKGVDTATLGLKVGEQRPDLLIFDDVEPHEEKYSADLAKKRLSTITSALLPLNVRARVVMVGTVTMPDSLMHQLVKSADDGEVAEWIRDEKIQAHHHLPILTDDEGNERSLWPEKWPLEWLQSFRHTRSYAKNYLNDPMGLDGDYWRMGDFRYGALTDPMPTRFLLQLDPAITTKGTSDYTGWAIVAFRPAQYEKTLRGSAMKVPPMCEVVDSGQVKLSGEALRAWVLGKLAQQGNIRAVRVEVNQGGDLWYTVLHDLPVELLVFTSSESKEVRFAYALDFYHRGLVVHRQAMRRLEEQMVSFPKAPYDDIADAAVCGILFFMRGVAPLPATQSHSYV